MATDKQIMEFLLNNKKLFYKLINDRTKGKPSHMLFEDIFQSVFLETSISIIKNKSYIQTDENNNIISIDCLSTIIARKVIDELRKIKKYNDNNSGVELFVSSLQSTVQSVEDEFINRETLKNIEKKLNKLDFDILTDYAEGFTYNDIAEKYEINLGTVKKKIHKIRIKLKQI
jgi:RNA polymerase sigma factor (sigma-70 family)